jgi:hypothetical protein
MPPCSLERWIGERSRLVEGSPVAMVALVERPPFDRDAGARVRGARWRITGAHLARESEITPSSSKVRRELFEIVLQEQILFAAR